MSETFWYTHVNQHAIRRNAKYATNEPVVRIQRGKYGKARYAHRVRFRDGEVIYSPHTPILPCGARLVIRTEIEPEVIES